MRKHLAWAANAGVGIYFFASAVFSAKLGPGLFLGMFLSALVLVLLPSRRLLHKILLFAGVLVMAIPWITYHGIGGSILSSMSSAPFQEIAKPNQLVTPGGSYFVISGYRERAFFTMVATTCFFLDDHTAVVAGHLTELDRANYSATLTTDDGHVQSGSVEVIADSEDGAILELKGISYPTDKQMKIGGTADITVGSPAEIVSSYGWTGQVIVEGYQMIAGAQHLVLTVDSPDRRFIQGMSGSPVVQDGQIIGFFVRLLGANYEGKEICFARIAADIYAKAVETAGLP